MKTLVDLLGFVMVIQGRRRSVAMCLGMTAALLAAISLASEDAGPKQQTAPHRDDSGEQGRTAGGREEYRVREGARLEDDLGEFREAGGRIRFYLKGENRSFTVLENLALERVSRVLDEHPTPRLWSVSGVVTEYRGGNFLMVTRALLKAKNRASGNSNSASLEK